MNRGRIFPPREVPHVTVPHVTVPGVPLSPFVSPVI